MGLILEARSSTHHLLRSVAGRLESYLVGGNPVVVACSVERARLNQNRSGDDIPIIESSTEVILSGMLLMTTICVMVSDERRG